MTYILPNHRLWELSGAFDSAKHFETMKENMWRMAMQDAIQFLIDNAPAQQDDLPADPPGHNGRHQHGRDVQLF